MTVVAFDGQQLASDSALNMGDGLINRVVKIAAVEPALSRPYVGLPSIILFGTAGESDAFFKVHEFLSGITDKLDLKGKSDALIVTPEGAWFWTNDRPMLLIKDAKAAIGTGASAALAAMFAGASAARAVEIATALIDSCEGPVQAFTLPEPVEETPTVEPPEIHEVQADEQQ